MSRCCYVSVFVGVCFILFVLDAVQVGLEYVSSSSPAEWVFEGAPGLWCQLWLLTCVLLVLYLTQATYVCVCVCVCVL